jgi:hypothetical protein
MANKKDTLNKEFERLYDDVDGLFKPIWDSPQEKFMEAIADLQKKGVAIIDINNVNQVAYAQPNNYSITPNRRVAIIGGKGKALKYYQLEHPTASIESADLPHADGVQELTVDQFEEMCIPSYTKPNPLQDPKDTKEDYEPTQEDVEGSKPGPDKKMSVKKDEKPLGLKPDHPEVKSKTVEYGDTSSPKNKIKEISEGFVNKIKKAIEE